MELIRALNDVTQRRLATLGQVAHFDPMALAAVIEREVNRAAEHNLAHLRIEVDLRDAMALAAFLRRGALLGA